MSGWNFNIEEAPRGRHFTRTVSTKDGDRFHDDFEPQWIWAASKCGRVLKTHWVPEGGKRKPRWLYFAENETPIAWQEFIVPSHPNALEDAA